MLVSLIRLPTVSGIRYGNLCFERDWMLSGRQSRFGVGEGMV
jgi:hypothetical protein